MNPVSASCQTTESAARPFDTVIVVSEIGEGGFEAHILSIDNAPRKTLPTL